MFNYLSSWGARSGFLRFETMFNIVIIPFVFFHISSFRNDWLVRQWISVYACLVIWLNIFRLIAKELFFLVPPRDAITSAEGVTSAALCPLGWNSMCKYYDPWIPFAHSSSICLVVWYTSLPLIHKQSNGWFFMSYRIWFKELIITSMEISV